MPGRGEDCHTSQAIDLNVDVSVVELAYCHRREFPKLCTADRGIMIILSWCWSNVGPQPMRSIKFDHVTSQSYATHDSVFLATTHSYDSSFISSNSFQQFLAHYDDFMMDVIASQITSLASVYSDAHIKENIKAPRHWPLCGEFTGDRWIPRSNGQ